MHAGERVNKRYTSLRKSRRQWARAARGPRFVYLMCSGKEPYIGISSNPFYRVASHNRIPGVRPGPKSTLRDEEWVLEMVVGPFTKGSHIFKDHWRRHSRKYNCRLVHGCLKGLVFWDIGLRVYARDPEQVAALCESMHRQQEPRIMKTIPQLMQVPLLCAEPAEATASASEETKTAAAAAETER